MQSTASPQFSALVQQAIPFAKSLFAGPSVQGPALQATGLPPTFNPIMPAIEALTESAKQQAINQPTETESKQLLLSR